MKKENVIFLLLSFIFVACGNKDEAKLRDLLQEEYSNTTSIKKLSSGSKAQYIQMEEAINKRYVRELDSLVNTYFDRQLEKFEDHELGLWNTYMNMFSWLFRSKDGWNEELNLISKKYFNNLDSQQEQNKLYNDYANQIKGLRQQFLKSHNLPTYRQIDIPSEEISLEKFMEHARNNAGIEILSEFLGGTLFAWLLGIFLTWLCVTVLGLAAGPPGWVADLIIFVVVLIISVILTSINDSRLTNNLREQHEEIVQVDNTSLLNELNSNTIKFYEKL